MNQDIDKLVALLEAQVPIGTPISVCHLLDEAADTIATIAKRLEEAEAAIRPFATEADAWSEYADAENLVEGWNGGPASIICVADLRAARRWLEDK